MLHSSIRKRAISGWLKLNQSREFSSYLKLQKFLFFYEVISKIENDEHEFRKLKGYRNGPVFSDVYGDQSKNSVEFSQDVERSYESYADLVNEERAKFAGFLVRILNEKDLSNLTHRFHIWKVKKDEIEAGVRQVPLRSEDLNDGDADLIASLRNMYPSDFIDSVKVIEMNGKSFVINKDDFEQLSDEQRSVFISMSEVDDLKNPVYVTLDEDGVMLID